MVARALPDIWPRASPEQALTARLEGAVAALRSLLPPDPEVWAAAADLLESAAQPATTDGRNAMGLPSGQDVEKG